MNKYEIALSYLKILASQHNNKVCLESVEVLKELVDKEKRRND